MKNFKVRCIDQNISDYFVTGDIYEVIDGVIMSKNNTPYNPADPYFTIEEINRYCVPQFELVEEKPFTKADIKNGMVVTYRNGCKRVVFDKVFYDYTENEIGVKSGNILKEYDNNLIRCDGFEGLDIMEVEYEGEVLWTRKEYYTLEEACKIAKKEGKRIKHKEHTCEYRASNLCKLVCHVIANTDRDLFELINAKEFEVVE